jgi:CspA family cold shock protein
MSKYRGRLLAEREIGTVRWFDATQGIGFIERAEGSDVFVHFSAIRGQYFRTLNEGQQVEFHVSGSEKGPLASDVVVAQNGHVKSIGVRSWSHGRRRLDESDLHGMLEEHRLFIESREQQGLQLDLWGTDLRGVGLRGADCVALCWSVRTWKAPILPVLT